MEILVFLWVEQAQWMNQPFLENFCCGLNPVCDFDGDIDHQRGQYLVEKIQPGLYLLELTDPGTRADEKVLLGYHMV